MWTFTSRIPRSRAASLNPSGSAASASIPGHDKPRGKQAGLRLLVALAAPCLASLAIVAFLILKLVLSDAAPLRCFVLHGDAALRACEDVIASDEPAEIRAEAQYNRGVELYDLGRHVEAARAYGEAVRLRPDYAAAYTNMGAAFAKLSRWDEAVDAYRAAIQARPQYAAAHYNRGVALVALRRWSDALDAFREAVRLNPADAEALYNVGLMLNLLHRHREALEAYNSATRIKPDYADAWGNLGMTAYLLGRYKESVDAFEHARSLVPTYFDHRDVLRRAWEEMRRGDRGYPSADLPRTRAVWNLDSPARAAVLDR